MFRRSIFSLRQHITANPRRCSGKRAGLLLALLCCLSLNPVFAQNVVVVVIDGARYSETFGDTDRTYIPQMGQLALEGAYLGPFYNDNHTYTSRAIPALWCGSWTEVEYVVYEGISTQAAIQPTLFEYYRRQKAAPADQCYYVLKYISDLWLPSFHQDYGPSYWPTYHSVGQTDDDVLTEALWVMDTHHPQYLWVYLADVDSRGHSGNWANYTSAIRKADSAVAVIWDAIQTDSLYANNTTLLVTNDHGRHDDAHGGFSGHGDGCDGCRQIMFLALGPRIRTNFVSTQYHTTPDFAVTAAALLEVDPEYATGEVIDEIFLPLQNEDHLRSDAPERFRLFQNHPNPFNSTTVIRYDVAELTSGRLIIYNTLGREIARIAQGPFTEGVHSIGWDGKDGLGRDIPAGIYLLRLTTPGYSRTIKMLYLK
jgi:hypothetical protein